MAQTATETEPTAEKITIARGVMPHEYSFMASGLENLARLNPPRYVIMGNHISAQIVTGLSDKRYNAPPKSEVIVPVDQFPTTLNIEERYPANKRGTVIEFYEFDGDIPEDHVESTYFFLARPDLVRLVDIVHTQIFDIFHSLPPEGNFDPTRFSSARFQGMSCSGADFRMYFNTKTDVAKLQGRILEVRVNGTGENYAFLFPTTPTPAQ